MTITDFGVFGNTVDKPNESSAFVVINGVSFSFDGYINAMVDLRLERYLQENNLPSRETFDKLKYSDGEFVLRKLLNAYDKKE